MKKKLLGILVVAAMMICAIPMTASAGVAGVFVKGIYLENGYTYAKAVGEGVYELSGIKNDGTVRCVYESDDSATLYLNSVEIALVDQEQLGDGLIYSTTPKINIVLAGENKIVCNSTKSKPDCIKGTNITLSGTGSLYTESNESCGIDASTGYLTIDGVKVTGKTRGATLYASDIVNINGASVIDAKSTVDAAIMGLGGVNFNLTSGGSVKASTSSDAYGAVMTITTYNGSINLAANNVITLPKNGMIAKDDYFVYIVAPAEADPAKEVTVEYVAKIGADTSDSSDIALFGILGLLALCGAGFVYKRREN